MLFRKNVTMVEPDDALPGRTDQSMPVPEAHYVNGNPLVGPWPEGMEVAVVGMGCFWGAERIFWQLDGVYSTFVGYAGGFTPNCTYEENCTGLTGHAEAVGIVYDPKVIGFERIMQVFWESHDPTQEMGQGNDRGSQYRTAAYATQPDQLPVIEATRAVFQEQLDAKNFGQITTEVKQIDFDTDFYYAEPYHQQYLAKNPNGYCGISGTGVSCPIGLGA
ncbi:peptide-methionine (S)-S-oxide reductase MsrA [Ilumatobacter sp.]|uniref:peptide-methionine (S)-S-oxide reductase MsrA n=1 Tax=Ilumatobacter sp. TaxID=1967498 RepID=UPI003C58B19A